MKHALVAPDLIMSTPLHQRAHLDADRIDPPPPSLPDADVVYDHLLELASLAQALDPDLPTTVRFVRYAPADPQERNTASFRMVFTSDTRTLSQGAEREQTSEDLWSALDRLLPPQMVQGHRASLAAAPAFGFAAAADAAIYSAFLRRGLALETRPASEDRVVQLSSPVTPPDLGFLSDPTLARWIYLCPGTGRNDEADPTLRQWRTNIQFLRQTLAQPWASVSPQDRAQVKELVSSDRARDQDPRRFHAASFERTHDHGWIGYALAAGGKGWTPALLTAGADPYAAFNGVSPMCWAIAADDAAALGSLTALGVPASTLLTAAPRVYKAPEQDTLRHRMGSFQPLLMFAAAVGASASVSALLRAGADPNATDPRSSTALHLAAAVNDERTVRVLLAHHARLDIEDEQGRLASQRIPVTAGDSLFHMLESLRLAEATPTPPVDVLPSVPAGAEPDSADRDVYGEPLSPWATALAPPRSRRFR